MKKNKNYWENYVRKLWTFRTIGAIIGLLMAAIAAAIDYVLKN